MKTNHIKWKDLHGVHGDFSEFSCSAGTLSACVSFVRQLKKWTAHTALHLLFPPTYPLTCIMTVTIVPPWQFTWTECERSDRDPRSVVGNLFRTWLQSIVHAFFTFACIDVTFNLMVTKWHVVDGFPQDLKIKKGMYFENVPLNNKRTFRCCCSDGCYGL